MYVMVEAGGRAGVSASLPGSPAPSPQQHGPEVLHQLLARCSRPHPYWKVVTKAPESWMTTICQQGIIFFFFFFSYSIILHLMSLFLVPKLPVVYSVHSFHQYFLILMTFHGRGCSLECQHCFPQPEAVGREGERREREAGGEGRQGCINYSERSRGSRCDDTDCRNYDKCSDLHPTPIR